MKLSVVVPVFNEAEVINEFYERLQKSLRKDFKFFNYEIIFVNDGSIDQTQKFIELIKKKNKKVKFIKFTKNFGQHSAIYAGLKHSTGDYIAVTDADLQDRPEEIINLYKKLQKGYNVVYSVRRENIYPFFKKYSSLVFWKTLKLASGLNIPENQSMLKVFDRKILVNVLAQEEIDPFLPIIFARAGLKQAMLYVRNDDRKAGKSKYSINKMVKLAINAIFYYSFLRILMIFLLFYVIFNTLMIILLNISKNYSGLINFLYLFIISLGMIIISLSLMFLKRSNHKYEKRSNYKIKEIK